MLPLMVRVCAAGGVALPTVELNGDTGVAAIVGPYTERVTNTVWVPPATAMLMAPLYVPGARPVMSTDTVKVAGVLVLPRLTASQEGLEDVATTGCEAPLVVTEIVCESGVLPPD